MACSAIFVSAAVFTMLVAKFPQQLRCAGHLLRYGDIDESRFTLRKSSFCTFYLVGTLACRLGCAGDDMTTFLIFSLHCKRRLLESIWLLFLPSGAMNVTHWVYGMVYYFALASYFCANHVKVMFSVVIFVILGVCQSGVHCLYMMEKGHSGRPYARIRAPLRQIKHGSYVSELLFYGTMFAMHVDLVSVSNLFWVGTFVWTKTVPYT